MPADPTGDEIGAPRMSRADELRQRAREVDDHSWAVRYTNPMESRALHRLAGELADLAQYLPPERTET